MKKTTNFLALFLCLVLSGWTTGNEISVVNDVDEMSRHYWVKGEKAKQVMKVLLSEKEIAGNTKHRVRNITVPGVSGELTLKILEGEFGCTEKMKPICDKQPFGANYFNLFKNKSSKEKAFNDKTDKNLGIIIYVQKSRNKSITTKEESKAFENYLEQLK